jgi:hypothetical protein
LQQLQIAVTGSPVRGLPARGTGGLLAMVADDAVGDVELWVSEMEDRVNEINNEELTTRKEFIETLENQIELLRESVGDPPTADGGGDPSSDQPPAPAPEAAEPDELAGF